MKGKLHYIFSEFKTPCHILLIGMIILIAQPKAFAQDPLMAKGNKALTFSFGVTNIYKTLLNVYLADKDATQLSTNSLSYSVKMSNPVVVTYDYAVSDYTTIGIGINYYSIKLNERRESSTDTLTTESNGYKASLQIRGIRYLVQKAGSVFYFYAGAGVRFRKLDSKANENSFLQTAYIYQFPETSLSGYTPLSLDAGLGLKFLLTKKIGLSAEFGLTTGIAQIGLFYSFKNKWRKSNDNIGW
jgi:hypothetical protein